MSMKEKRRFFVEHILLPFIWVLLAFLGSAVLVAFEDEIQNGLQLKFNPYLISLVLCFISLIGILAYFIFRCRKYKRELDTFQQKLEEKEEAYKEKEQKLLIVENKNLNNENLLNNIKRVITYPFNEASQMVEQINLLLNSQNSREILYRLTEVIYDVFIDYDQNDKSSDIYCAWNIHGVKISSTREMSTYKLDLRGDSRINRIEELNIKVTLSLNGRTPIELKNHRDRGAAYSLEPDGTTPYKKVLKINFGRALRINDTFHLIVKYKWPKTYENLGDRFTINPGALYDYECVNLKVTVHSKEKCFECARLSSAEQGAIQDKYVECLEDEWGVTFTEFSDIAKNLYSIETYQQ